MRIRTCITGAVAAVALAFGVSAMAQGRPGGPPAGRPGMGGPGMASQPSSMGQRGQMGQADQRGQTGQMGQMSTRSNPKTVQDQLQQNSKLSSQLQTLLGSGTNLQQASSGFKNLGQFVAAAHVAKNLDIPFDKLKGQLQTDGGNLGKAIHALQPSLTSHQVKGAVSEAKKQASQDIRNSRH